MAKTVDIEYTGDPPVLDDVTKFRIAAGELHPETAALLRGADTQRSQVIPGVTKRVVDPEYFGTSRQYSWGPQAGPDGRMITAVDTGDVDKILGSESGHQFRVAGTSGVEIIRPASDFVLVDEIEGKSLTDVYR